MNDTPQIQEEAVVIRRQFGAFPNTFEFAETIGKLAWRPEEASIKGTISPLCHARAPM